MVQGFKGKDLLSQICPPWWVFGFGAWASGRWQNTRATHAPPTRPLTFLPRHSRATHAPLTFALREVAFLLFTYNIYPFAVTAIFRFGFHCGRLFFCGFCGRGQRHSPATRATRAPSPAVRAAHPPHAPLTRRPRHAPAARTTHRRRRPAMGWS